MTEEQYIKERLNDQISWYSRKSAINKKLHLNLNGLIIICAAAIPAFTAFTSGELHDPVKYIIGVLGVLTAGLTGISSLYKFQEKWTTYRTVAEALEREKILYETSAGQYSKDIADFKFFVQNIEKLMSNENSEWTAMINSSGNSEQGS
ncbi:MAG: DUF4231 domain-containing protein [Flavobacteriaceae bacterium]